MFSVIRVCSVFALILATASRGEAAEWHVAVGGKGSGTLAAPFGSIQSAIEVAQPGDTITVQAGQYGQRLLTRRHGIASAPITIRAASGPGTVIVTLADKLLQVDHAYHVVDGFVFDAQYAFSDALDINSGATAFVLRNSEVRRATKDCIDMAAPANVLIDRSLIHHCLNAAAGRTDAHGIVAGAVRDLTIRDTEIHTFSGDALQLDPDRAAPGWDRITIEGCRFWLAPLPTATNGFAAGTVPGENGIDTKTLVSAPRGRLTVRNTVAYGFRQGLISNMAAFNLKENIDALLDGVVVYDSEVAFRNRGEGANGGAWVRIQNALVYNVERAIRYEDDIERLQVFNVTLGANVGRAFQPASTTAAGLDVRNVLLLAAAKPSEAANASNLAVDASAFESVANNDYRLREGSAPIDIGIGIDGVNTDIVGTARPQGVGFDVGAFETIAAPTGTLPTASIANVNVVEPQSNSDALFVIRLSAPSTQSVRLPWSTRARSATANQDFVPATGVLTLDPGQTQGDVRVRVLGDSLDEAEETFEVVLGSPEGAVIEDGIARSRIIDDADASPTVSIDTAATVVEGSLNVKVTLQLSLSSISGQTVKVTFATKDGTAVAGSDYVAATGTVSFSPGVQTRTITLTVLADAIGEGNEQFAVTLSNPSNATLAASQAVITVADRASQ